MFILPQWESHYFKVCNMPQPLTLGIYVVYHFYLSYLCMLTSIYNLKKKVSVIIQHLFITTSYIRILDLYAKRKRKDCGYFN